MGRKKHNFFHGQFVKQGKAFVPLNAVLPKYKLFLEGAVDGQLVDVFMEAHQDDGTLPQIARIHVCIRELAKETGESFSDMKLRVKKRSGMCVEKEMDGEKFIYCKSFAECSKEELSMVIETINEIGNIVGVVFPV